MGPTMHFKLSSNLLARGDAKHPHTAKHSSTGRSITQTGNKCKQRVLNLRPPENQSSDTMLGCHLSQKLELLGNGSKNAIKLSNKQNFKIEYNRFEE